MTSNKFLTSKTRHDVKYTKKLLRQALRQANATSKTRIYEDIANASPRDTKLFHRLIRKQRAIASSPGTELMIDSRLISGIYEVLEPWTTHFNHLATPQNASCFDEKHKQLVEEDLLVMQWCATNTQQTHIEKYAKLSVRLTMERQRTSMV